MIKVLLNKDFGGFKLPDDFIKKLSENKKTLHYTEIYEGNYYLSNQWSYTFRTDPEVIKLFEDIYPNGCGSVKLEKVDDERYPNWYVHEYDGVETIVNEIVNHGFPRL